MILDVKPVHGLGYDCIEDSIVTIVSWYKRDYQMMFMKSWNFNFDYANPKSTAGLGKRIKVDSGNGNQLNYLEDYHGIKSVVHDNIAVEKVLNFIITELESHRPVFIILDSFYCPEDQNFQKNHSRHAVVITGIDYNSSNLYFTDSMTMKQNICLPYNFLIQGFYGCCTFELIKNYSKEMNWREIIQNVYFELLGEDKTASVFENIRRFGNEMERTLDFEAEMQGYTYFSDTPLFLNVRKTGRARKKFSGTLQYMGERYCVEGLLVMSEKLKLLGSKWETVGGMITKAFISNKLSESTGKISNKIRELAAEEEEIAHNLIDICKKGYERKTSASVKIITQSCSEDKNIVFLKLDEYLNNNGFSSEFSINCKADLTLLGHWFLAENLMMDKLWEVGDMKFKLNNLSSDSNDNISCSNEKIKLPENTGFDKIMLLGCSECGDFSDKIIIEYCDGTYEKIIVSFTDWASEPVFNELVAFRGRGAIKDNGEVRVLAFETKLFSKAFHIKNRGAISSISLPDCPNMHIFAISFA